MQPMHQFGGQWTEEKLDVLRKYLHAYQVILDRNKKAQWFDTTFVDAFAGTGYRSKRERQAPSLPLTLEGLPIYDPEATQFQKGSALIALETDPPFDKYVFIETNVEYVRELEQLRSRFPLLANRIEVVQGDANTVLVNWCRTTDWGKNRGVVFLDPYGMQVDWTTIEVMAETRGIDLWILFPLGQAVMRVLTRNRPPEGAWAQRLTRFFGTSEWKDAFYAAPQQPSLFGEDDALTKTAEFDQIAAFFIRRLASIFARVSEKPLYLRNSKNIPLFLLCFAAANDRGAPVAVKIANDVMGKWR